VNTVNAQIKPSPTAFDRILQRLDFLMLVAPVNFRRVVTVNCPIG